MSSSQRTLLAGSMLTGDLLARFCETCRWRIGRKRPPLASHPCAEHTTKLAGREVAVGVSMLVKRIRHRAREPRLAGGDNGRGCGSPMIPTALLVTAAGSVS